MCSYLYCRTHNIGNVGPARAAHIDTKAGSAANGVTTYATEVSLKNGHPVYGHAPPPAPAPVFNMGVGPTSEGVPPPVNP